MGPNNLIREHKKFDHGIFRIIKDIIMDTNNIINETCNLNIGQNNLIHDLRKFENENILYH